MENFFQVLTFKNGINVIKNCSQTLGGSSVVDIAVYS